MIVDFLYVGLGDCAVIWLTPKSVILIDAGPARQTIPSWLERNRIRVEAVILTHNDRDHAGGLVPLLKRSGVDVGAVAFLEDRVPDEQQRGQQKVIRDWCNGTRKAFRIEISHGMTQDMLSQAGVSLDATEEFRLEAIYPNFVDNLGTREQRPNYSSAIIVLWHSDIARVVWPGDQSLSVCIQELERLNISPQFVVGPHHGGPQDIKDRKEQAEEIEPKIIRIGHECLWISVGWHAGYKLPYSPYVEATSRSRPVVCSEVTPHCHDKPGELGDHLLPIPTSELFAIPSPNSKRPSCMGHMRVKFSSSNPLFEILCHDELDEAIRAKVGHPLCRKAPETKDES